MPFGSTYPREEVLSLKPATGASVELSARPSCTSLQEFQGNVYAFVGTIAGSLQVFCRNSSGSSLHMAFEHEFQDDFGICDSIAMVVDEGSAWLVCGLRNGTCQTLSVSTEGQSYQDLTAISHVSLAPLRDLRNPLALSQVRSLNNAIADHCS